LLISNRPSAEDYVMQGKHVRWDDRGPDSNRKRVTLVRPGVGGLVRVVLLCARVTGIWLHWVEGRSVPCLGEDEGCPMHDGRDNWGLRWKGFMGCMTLQVSRPPNQLLEVTQDGWHRSLHLRQLSDTGKLRGVEVQARRGSKGPRARVAYEVLCGGALVRYAANLPEEPDTKALLAVLFPSVVGPGAERRVTSGRYPDVTVEEVRRVTRENDEVAEGERPQTRERIGD